MSLERSDFENMKALYEENVFNEMAFGYGEGSIPVTQVEFIEKIKLAHKLGAKPISITTVTTPSQSKKNPYYPIYKVSQVNGMLNFDYEDAVNRQREREGKEADFAQSGRKWGAPFIDDEGKTYPGLIVNNGVYYVQIKVENTRSPVYVGTTETGRCPMDPEAAKELVRSSEDAGPAQGVDKGIIVRTYKISNIIGASVAGHEYKITDVDEEKQDILKIVGLS